MLGAIVPGAGPLCLPAPRTAALTAPTALRLIMAG